MFLPEFLVVNLILSDGDKSKFERKALFNPNWKYVGINSGMIEPNKVCTIINFLEDFYFINEMIPFEIQNKFKDKKTIYNSKIIPNKKLKKKIIKI